MKTFFVLVSTILFFNGCASWGKDCTEWKLKDTYYSPRMGAVDKINVWTCTKFSSAP